MSNSNGNVFIYILIAVVLMAGLTFALSKNQENDPSAEISEAQTRAVVSSIISYASSLQSAVNQMTMNGDDATTINFILPSETAYDTPPNTSKLFHPDGGGINYKPLPAGAAAADIGSPAENGFYVGRVTNVEYSTPTTASDIIMLAFGLNLATCQALNKKITGSTAIPTMTSNNNRTAAAAMVTTPTGTVSATYAITGCATCEEKPSLCVLGSEGFYTFYSVLLGR